MANGDDPDPGDLKEAYGRFCSVVDGGDLNGDGGNLRAIKEELERAVDYSCEGEYGGLGDSIYKIDIYRRELSHASEIDGFDKSYEVISGLLKDLWKRHRPSIADKVMSKIMSL